MYNHGVVLGHRSRFTAFVGNCGVIFIVPFFDAFGTLVLLADVEKCEAVAAVGSYCFCRNLFSPSAAGCRSVTRRAEAVHIVPYSNSA
jgi:hypothetical protein